jgi:hypothetical protein
MAAKRVHEGGEGFQDHAKRTKGDDPVFVYDGLLRGSARLSSFEKVRYWWGMLHTFYNTHFATPTEGDWDPIYLNSKIVLAIVQADLLVDAVERGPYPRSDGLFDMSKYLMHSYSCDDVDNGDDLIKDDVRYATTVHYYGCAVLASVTRGWKHLVALEQIPRLEGELKSKKEIEEKLYTTLCSLDRHSGQACYQRDHTGGKQVIFSGGSVVAGMLQQRARDAGLTGPCLKDRI